MFLTDDTASAFAPSDDPSAVGSDGPAAEPCFAAVLGCELPLPAFPPSWDWGVVDDSVVPESEGGGFTDDGAGSNGGEDPLTGDAFTVDQPFEFFTIFGCVFLPPCPEFAFLASDSSATADGAGEDPLFGAVDPIPGEEPIWFEVDGSSFEWCSFGATQDGWVSDDGYGESWPMEAEGEALQDAPDGDPISDPFAAEVDPLPFEVPIWRGGDAPLPYWRCATAVEEAEPSEVESSDFGFVETDKVPVLYALDQVIEPKDGELSGPAVQVCTFSLGAPLSSPPAVSGSPDQPASAAAGAVAVDPLTAGRLATSLPSVPDPEPMAVPQQSGDEPQEAPADASAADRFAQLLSLSQSGSTGVEAPASWRELHPAALHASRG